MQLEIGYLYHIFNQGNNHRKIFYKQENYLFFLKKIKENITPYADILAWCLMPNHFHLMIFINKSEIYIEQKNDDESLEFQKIADKQNKKSKLTLNDSIGILLRSYTRAINKQEKSTGSLFRAHTKAECLNCPNGITPSFINASITEIKVSDPEKEYPRICFEYIHQNPVKSNLVKHQPDWEFSSARDYEGLRNGKLVNKELALEYFGLGTKKLIR